MNKKLLNITLISGLLFLVFLLFEKYSLLSELSLNAITMFIYKALPFLFTMSVINNLLIELNFPYFINKIFHNNYLYIFIASALSGSPINAIILERMLEENTINEKDASMTLAFTTLNNPLFLYNYFNIIFDSSKITLKFFLIIYVLNLIIYFFLAKKLSKNLLVIPYKPVSFSKSFVSSLKSSSQSMLNIAFTIIFFYIISGLVTGNPFFKGLIEITTGLNALSISNYSLIKKELLTIVILSFAGLSIHIQIASILSKYQINYKYFYLSRLFLIITSSFAVLVLRM